MEVKDISNPLNKLKRVENVELLFGNDYEVKGLKADSDEIQIEFINGNSLKFDHCLIALGATYYPERIEGLNEYMRNICSLEDMINFKTKLNTITSGTILLTISSVPYKCPPAPFEYVFLIDQVLTQRGIKK